MLASSVSRMIWTFGESNLERAPRWLARHAQNQTPRRFCQVPTAESLGRIIRCIMPTFPEKSLQHTGDLFHVPDHSYRSDTKGSTLAARLAGR